MRNVFVHPCTQHALRGIRSAGVRSLFPQLSWITVLVPYHTLCTVLRYIAIGAGVIPDIDPTKNCGIKTRVSCVYQLCMSFRIQLVVESAVPHCLKRVVESAAPDRCESQDDASY
jgi:hypothetical protein